MDNVIETLQDRSFIDSLSSEEISELVKKPIKFYIGFDPTAESLHIGNLVGIIAASWFQKHGHKPILLVGGATGKIGDPSGKSHERPLLSEETLNFNVSSIKAQLEKILDFTDEKTRPLVLNNEDWYKTFTATEFLRDIGKQFRMGVMLGKDSVKSRLSSEEGMSYTEFSYQVLQGYDFYHLYKSHNVVLEIGGSDQWGNITSGIEYTRKVAKTSVYGMTFPLLTRSDGQKFGKSEGGAVWLSSKLCSPYKFYQYLYRILDADVIKLLKMLTFLPISKINELEKELSSGALPPNTAQKLLAEEVTRFVHGERGLEVAKKVTQAAAPGSKAILDLETLKEIKGDIPTAHMNTSEIVGSSYVDVVVLGGLLSSKSEASRLIKNGGAYLNNQKIDDPKRVLDQKDLIGGEFLLVSAGKKKRMLIEVLN